MVIYLKLKVPNYFVFLLFSRRASHVCLRISFVMQDQIPSVCTIPSESLFLSSHACFWPRNVWKRYYLNKIISIDSHTKCSGYAWMTNSNGDCFKKIALEWATWYHRWGLEFCLRKYSQVSAETLRTQSQFKIMLQK